MKVDKRTLPDRASHDLPLLLRVTRPDDHLVGLLVVTGARALGRLAPRGHRMTAARGAAFTTAVRVVDRVLGDAAGQRPLADPAFSDRLAPVGGLVGGGWGGGRAGKGGGKKG